jgi:hypothetical protein
MQTILIHAFILQQPSTNKNAMSRLRQHGALCLRSTLTIQRHANALPNLK